MTETLSMQLPCCVVTLPHEISQQFELDPSIATCLGDRITDWLEPEIWQAVVAIVQERQYAEFEYDAQLIGCDRLFQLHTSWELKGNAIHGTVLSAVDVHDEWLRGAYQRRSFKVVSEITCTCEDSTDKSMMLGHNGLDKPSSFPEMSFTFLESLDRWLTQIAPTPVPKISVNSLFVDCLTLEQVRQLLETAGWLKSSEIKLIIITLRGSYYGHVSTDKLKSQSVVNSMQASTTARLWAGDMLSQWARQNERLFDSEPGITYIHSADRDSGYRILAARSELTDLRLNKPIQKLLGQPLATVDSQIAVASQRVVEAAIADPSQVHFDYYEYQDPPSATGFCALWRFQVSAIYLPEFNEVKRKTIDNPNDPRALWQEPAWRYGQRSNILVNA